MMKSATPSQMERSSLRWLSSLKVSSVSFSTIVPLYEREAIRSRKIHRLPKNYQEKSCTSGSSRSLSGEASALRRSLTASLYISIAENFKMNSLFSCCEIKYFNLTKSRTKITSAVQESRTWYPFYVIIDISHTMLGYPDHCMCLSTASLSIGKYSC